MVKVAIAGGSSAVAKAIINALVVTQKHELLLLSRKDARNEGSSSNITWVKADYQNLDHLVKILQGVHTVLSFIPTQSDPGNSIQRNLVNAAIQVGAKRFAPSEWATSTFDHISWYAGKAEMREYLKEMNKEKKVIEYSLFQPGLFVDYLTYPFESPEGIRLNEVAIDFHNRRAILLDGGEERKITLTTSKDLANTVARAVEYEGEWPVVGGVKGSELTFNQVIALGEKIRGGSFKVEKLKAEDLKAGIVKSSWMPKVDHPVIPPEEAQKWAPIALSAVLLSFAAEAWNVSDEWNRLLPDYKFTDAEQFLGDAWRNK